MSTVATKFQLGTKKFSMSTAAVAVAAAAALTPVVAEAAPAAPLAPVTSFAQGLGSSAILWPVPAPGAASSGVTAKPAAAATPGSNKQANASANSIIQNPFWWFGPANPNWQQKQILVGTFAPIQIPIIGPLFFGWLKNANFEACLLGVSIKIGAYGTTSVGLGKGC